MQLFSSSLHLNIPLNVLTFKYELPSHIPSTIMLLYTLARLHFCLLNVSLGYRCTDKPRMVKQCSNNVKVQEYFSHTGYM